jgi:hypothetical protein
VRSLRRAVVDLNLNLVLIFGVTLGILVELFKYNVVEWQLKQF